MTDVSRRDALKQLAASPLLLASLPQSDPLLDAVDDAEDLKLLGPRAIAEAVKKAPSRAS
jgi:hypothetical protein